MNNDAAHGLHSRVITELLNESMMAIRTDQK